MTTSIDRVEMKAGRRARLASRIVNQLAHAAPLYFLDVDAGELIRLRAALTSAKIGWMAVRLDCATDVTEQRYHVYARATLAGLVTPSNSISPVDAAAFVEDLFERHPAIVDHVHSHSWQEQGE